MNLESPVSDSSGLEGGLFPYLDDEVHEQSTDVMYGIVCFFSNVTPYFSITGQTLIQLY